MTPNASSLSQTASTLGWDTVFAAPVGVVNRAIVAQKSSPLSFANTHVERGVTTVASATFGDWQLAAGGDGKDVRMTVPMRDITLDGTNHGSGSVTIEVRLHYLPHTDIPAPPAGQWMKLMVKTTSDTPDTDPVVVVVGDVALESGSMGIIEQAIFKVGFEQWINLNLGDFTHIFAVVNVYDKIDAAKQWTWTKPSYLDYAYLDGATPATSTFGVLAMTAGRTGERNTEQISPNAIPGGSQCGFLVAPQRYLDDLLKPALEHCYDGLTDDDMTLSNDGSSLHLKDGVTVKLKDVDHDGESYSPILAEFEITVLGDTMEIYSHTRTKVSPGIWSISKATHWYRIGLGTLPGGSQTLLYDEAQAAKVIHMTETSPGVEVAKVAAMIATAIAVIIAGVLTDGAAFVAAAVVIGALGGMAAETPDAIAAANTDDSPSIDALVLNVNDPILWPQSAGLTLDFAGLNESLQLGGTLTT